MPEESIPKTLCNTCILLVPALLSTGAFICSMVASFWCETIQFRAKDIELFEGITLDEIPDLHFGPWYQLEVNVETADIGGNTRVYTVKECVDWKFDPDIDSAWKTVRAFTIITAIVGGFATVALWFVPCAQGRITTALWQGVAVCIYVVMLTLFQGLTFLLFRSNACDANAVTKDLQQQIGGLFYEDECDWDTGSTANAIAVALWFCVGLLMVVTGAPTKPERPPPETQEVTYEKDEEGNVMETKVVKGTAVEAPADAEPVVEEA